MPEEIVVAIKGSNYSGWKAADVTCSMDAMCGMFNVSLSDRWAIQQVRSEIRPGDECQVFADGDPVITGFIDTVSPSISKDDHSVIISGRDKTCDLVDCSAEMESFEAYGITLDTLANMLCEPYGIAVKTETDVGAPFLRVAIEPGETVFDCLERHSRQRGVLLTTDYQGALVLASRSSFKDSGGAIVEGENLKSGTANYDYRDRFKTYKTHGQMPAFGNGSCCPVHDQTGEARDTNMMRHRPLLITCEQYASPDDAKIRAENECAYRAGRSTRVNVQVVGWRHSGGGLWRPREQVPVTSDSLHLPGTTLVISTVRYAFADGTGTVAELEMTRPDAYLRDCSGQVEEEPYALF